MKTVFKIYLIFLLIVFSGLFSVESQTKTEIKIENADLIQKLELTPSSNLVTVARAVPARIMIEYANNNSFQSLALPKEIIAKAKPVASRIVMEYAGSASFESLQKAEGLESVARAVPPRIIIEHAGLYISKALIRFIGDGGEIPPTTSTISRFTLSLDKGLNMISLPVKPQNSLTARSFTQQLGSTMVIRYDTKQDEFISFVPEVFTGNGFSITGGEGYIVNQLVAKDVVFTGTAWSNAPGKPASSAPSKDKEHWAFVVCGTLYDGNNIAQNRDILVIATNLRTGNSTEARVSQLESGKYIADFVNLNRKEVIRSGDTIEIRFKDVLRGILSKPIKHKVTPIDITNSYAEIPLRMEYMIPEKSLLLQNYPNPFNPETWIPYQLKENSDVVISIYTANGQLVCTLNLGYKQAGFYTDKGHAAYWDGKNENGEYVSSGIYFCTFKAGDFSATRKMMLKK